MNNYHLTLRIRHSWWSRNLWKTRIPAFAGMTAGRITPLNLRPAA